MQEIELLAPVGSWEALQAAVQNGADAVYFGGKAFNARQYASNFDDEELVKAVNYCHIRGVKTFVTVNTLVSNDELIELGKYLVFLYNHDVDAIIVQDLGVAKLVKDLLPDFEIHASTQMSIHNLEGVKLLEEIGFQRVVLAREMTKEEIRYVKENTQMDIEIFVHGALCICYSGQCLMSSMIGGRSGNRGRCAQPCRMTYSLIDLDDGKEIKSNLGDYLLSPRDLNTLESIDEVLDIGVKSLKIEGRMKRPEYVATVIRAYRDAIDQYKKTKIKPQITENTRKDVEQIFNRKFTKGYILGEKGQNIVNFTKPSNRGIKIGIVIGYDKQRKRVRIKLDEDLRKGDGIEIWIGKGDNPGVIVDNIYVKGIKKDFANKGDVVELKFPNSAYNNCPVFKTSDVELLKRAKETYERKDKSIELNGEFRGELGKKIELLLWDEKGHYVHQKGDYIVEKARKTSIYKERIAEQIGKLGDTPYVLKRLTVYLDEDVAIPISKLNELRRIAIEKLNRIRQKYHCREDITVEEFNEKFAVWFKADKEKPDFKSNINVFVNNMRQLKTVLDFPIYKVYYSDFLTIEEAIEITKAYDIKCVLALPRITEDQEIYDLRKKTRKLEGLDGVLVGNLGILYGFKKDMDLPIYGDYSLNIFNNAALQVLKKIGVAGATLSPELTLKQIRGIMKKTSMPCEAIVHGYLPVMITKYCPISAVLSTNNKQDSCSLCSSRKFGLRDRLGMIFPVISDKNCRVQILNPQKMCLIEHIKELMDAGIPQFRIQFTNENEDEVKYTMQAYTEAIYYDFICKSREISIIEGFVENMRKQGFTKGHYFRGVM